MRRSLLAPVLAVSALALAATPALAHKSEQAVNTHKFTGSSQVPVRAAGTGEQDFSFGPFAVTCESAKSVKGIGTSTWPSETLFVEMKYSGCEATATLHGVGELELKAKFLSPLSLNYHSNGFVEAGAGGTVVGGKLEGAGEVEIALSGPFKCTIDVEPGTFPLKAIKKAEEQYEAAQYKVEEVTIEKGKKTSVENKLAIATALTKLTYEFEGEFCEAFSRTEGKSGSYSGALLAELPKASLGFE
jgi:hypothetical protein